MRYANVIAVILLLSLAPATGVAQDQEEESDQTVDVETESEEGEDLPPAEADQDEMPPKPEPDVAVQDDAVVQQAGTGSQVAYGRPGVLELGGSAGFTGSESFWEVSFSPSVGYFIANNLQLSLILDGTYINFDDVSEGADDDRFRMTGLLEPSYHIPFTDRIFGFLGVGGGISYTSDVESGGVGLAVQPKVGLDIRLGRSGILKPAFTMTWNTVEIDEEESVGADRYTAAIETTYGFQIGYTIMW